MSLRVTRAVAVRVLQQLRRDPRTLALISSCRAVLDALLSSCSPAQPVFQHIGAPLLGLFPFITMFLVTSITMLRERTTGTLERLMTLPLGKARPARGLRDRVRGAGGVQAAVVSALRSDCSGSRSPGRGGSWSRSRSPTRCSASRSGCS